jgi:hypothetical protein
MTSVRTATQRDKKSWRDSIKDIGVIGGGVETISEGITRLNKALRNDKRTLRDKSP